MGILGLHCFVLQLLCPIREKSHQWQGIYRTPSPALYILIWKRLYIWDSAPHFLLFGGAILHLFTKIAADLFSREVFICRWRVGSITDTFKTALSLLSLRRKWQPTPLCLPGKSYGQRSLAGYSPWGHKELDTTEWVANTHTHTHTHTHLESPLPIPLV